MPATTVYYVITAVMAFGFALFVFISGLYRVQTVELNPLQLLLLGAALEGAVLIFEIPTGVVADVRSRRLSVIIGFAIIGAGLMLEGALAWFPTVLLAQAVWGVGYTFISGAQDAWLADEVGEENLTAIYLRGGQIGRVAGLLGLGVAILIGLYSLALPILIGGGLIMLLAPFCWLFMPETGFVATPAGERETYQKMATTFKEGVRTVRTSRLLLVIVAIAAIHGLSSEGIDRLDEAHLLTSFTFPTLWDLEPVVWFGGMSVIVSVVGLVATRLLQRRDDIESGALALKLSWVGNAGLLLGLFVFATTTNVYLAMSMLVTYRLFRSTLAPLYGAWVNKQIPSRVRATVLSMMGQVDAMSQLIGGPIVGVVATVLSLRIGLVTVAVLLAPVLVLYWLALRLAMQEAETTDVTPVTTS